MNLQNEVEAVCNQIVTEAKTGHRRGKLQRIRADLDRAKGREERRHDLRLKRASLRLFREDIQDARD